ncbi:MAG: TonB-dependent receptor [Prolixibacteraceae bacterium]|nr:TonB-dependent receptor [Prolixibacteraceae bacterium]
MGAFLLFMAQVMLQPVFAQKMKTDTHIIGDVQCKGEHLPFINITIDGSTIGTSTDLSGHYQLLNIPAGNHSVRASGVGYKEVVKTVSTKPGETIEIKFVVEEDVLNVEEVLVSASRNGTNRSEAAVIITALSPKLFAETQSVNIAEGLCFTPGLRTECNCTNCGFTQLRMNGMEGPYSQILMNSRPVFSGLAGVYGLELIPANMVERLEIIRGGGSALFGGSAIAGTVNIITKEPQLNTFSIDGRTSLIGIGEAAMDRPVMDKQVSLNASVVTGDSKSGGYVYGLMRNKEAYDENNDGFTESVMLDNSTFGFSLYHKPGSRSKLSLDGYRLNEFRRGGNLLHKLPHETDVTEMVDHLVSGVNLAYDQFVRKHDKITLYAAGQGVKRDSYYGANFDPSAYGFTKDFTSSAGLQYVINTENWLKGNGTTVLGIDNNNNRILDSKLGANGDENTVITNQMVNTIGSFVQHDLKTEHLNIGLGLRLDQYNISDLEHNLGNYRNLVLAPRANVLYKLSSNYRFRVGYAKGYRAPQVFSEDLHIEMVNARRVEHFNDENLVQETSHAFTASFNANFFLGPSINEILLEGFYTRLNNPFADEYFPLDNEGSWAYKRINATDGAMVSGLNLEINSSLSKTIEMQIGFTLQKSEFEVAQAWGEEEGHVSKSFVRSPNSYGYATLGWELGNNFKTNFSLNYTGSMLVPHFGLDPSTTDPLELQALRNGDVIAGERLEQSELFFIADWLFSYSVHLSDEAEIQFYAGVKNLFNQSQREHDRGKFRDAGYIYGPCQPRTINFGIRFGNLF